MQYIIWKVSLMVKTYLVGKSVAVLLWRVWLKNWGRYAHFNFELLKSMVALIFKPHPWNFYQYAFFIDKKIMFYKNFCIFNMILLISKSFFKPYFIQSLSVHIHPRKLYLIGMSVALLLHNQKLIWKVPILLHTEPRPYLFSFDSVPMYWRFLKV